MSYLEKFTVKGEAVPKDITIGDVTETAYFRHLTAAERQKLVTGQKVTTKEGETEIEVELGSNERTRQQMVFYCTVTAEGDQYFRNMDQVGKLTAQLVSALWKAANEVNKEDDDPGK